MNGPIRTVPRALSYGARRELAAILRADGNSSRAIDAFLTAYGSAVYDLIILMLGPGELAERVVTDTTVAVTSLARWLRDDDLLTAWVFALARHECRRYPPVVWRERHWEGMRSLAVRGPVGPLDSVPLDIVRMAVLGLAPKDREIVVLSSTYCKLLSGDLAAVFGTSCENVASAVAGAQARFEQALAMCAEEVGYQRDPLDRAPEIGELIGMVLSGVDRRLPAGRIFHVAQARELAAYRLEVISRIELSEADGFPLPWNSRRYREQPRVPAYPRQRHSRGMIRQERERSFDFVPG
jgi:DNA-directed RNA polymerase specialized sigma24 family protein